MVTLKSYQTLLLYLLVVTIVVVYSSTLTAESLSWNDDTTISFLDAMKKGNVSVWENSSVKPLPLAIFSYLYGFGDGSIFLFHLFNIIFHIANVILIFFLLFRNNQSFQLSILTAALFGLHPLQTGTVSWLSQFPVILSLTILLLSVYYYLIYRKENRNVHFWIVSVLAVMYYATAAGGMLFIVVLCCIDMLLTKKITKELVAEKIPFFLLAVISFSVSNISLVNLYYESIHFVRFGIIEGVYKIIVPSFTSGISPLQTIVDGSLLKGFSIYPLFIPLLILFIFWIGKNHKEILFAGIGFVAVGLPLISGFEGREWLLSSESYYYSSIFLFYIAAYGLLTLSNQIKIQELKNAVIIVVGVPIISSLAYQTFLNTKIWHSNISFWTQTKTEFPDNAFILNKLGTYHFSKFEIEDAVSNFSRSIDQHPEHYESYTNRGLVYLRMYETDSAKADFHKAIELYPHYALAYYNLALVHNVLSELDSAIINFSKAINLQPDVAQALDHRANAYAKQKKYVRAFADFETAIRIDPAYSDVYGNRALIFLETGNATEAAKNFLRQSELSPGRFDVFIHLGLTDILIGDTVSARAAIAKAMLLDSTNAKMYLGAVKKTFLREEEDMKRGRSVLTNGHL